jgi:hypothetical protein
LGEALGELGNSEFTVHTGAEGFWARRARTSVDVLGPGVLVGRVVVLGVFKRRFKRGFKLQRRVASVTGI